MFLGYSDTKRAFMKTTFFGLIISGLMLASCGTNTYNAQSESDNIPKDTSSTGYQTGAGTESIADPNAANTKRTPVPLDSVQVDTTHNSEK